MVDKERDLFELAREFEQAQPDVAEAMRLFGISMEKYQASLSAVYVPRIITADSTEDLSAHME